MAADSMSASFFAFSQILCSFSIQIRSRIYLFITQFLFVYYSIFIYTQSLTKIFGNTIDDVINESIFLANDPDVAPDSTVIEREAVAGKKCGFVHIY